MKQNKVVSTEYNRHRGKYPTNFIVVDVETTGLNVETEEIIQLSAIKYIDCKEVARYNQYINPGKRIPTEASKINGIYDNDVKNKPCINEVLSDFKDFIGEYTLVAHNASFDMKFIQTAFSTHMRIILCNKVIDTLSMSRKYIELPSHKLETLKSYLGINVTSHNAIDDCFVTGELYKHILNLKDNNNINVTQNTITLNTDVSHTSISYTQKNRIISIVLCCLGFIGIAGLHKFYEGKFLLGILYVSTLGCCFIGTILDLINLIKKEDTYYV